MYSENEENIDNSIVMMNERIKMFADKSNLVQHNTSMMTHLISDIVIYISNILF